MPPVPSPDAPERDDEAPAEAARKPSNAGTQETETERRSSIIARRLLAGLPALRLGALLSIVGAALLLVARPSDLGVGYFWILPIAVIPPFWLLTILIRPRPSRFRDPIHGSPIVAIRTAIAVLAIIAITTGTAWLTWDNLAAWSIVLTHTGSIAVELVAAATGTIGLALLAVSDIALRTLRAAALPPELYRRKGWQRLRPLRTGAPQPQGPRRRTVTHAALVLAPSVVLAGAAAVPLSLRRKPIQKLAPPPTDGTLPAYPTSLASKPAWTKDVSKVLDIAAGAAGPIVHTTDSVIGINPKDGSTLWSYERKDAIYETFGDRLSREGGQRYDRTLAVSPDHRHVAFRIAAPGIRKESESISLEALTIVLDTTTGKVVNEHPSQDTTVLQITDSAILDGTKIYAIGSDVETWDFEEDDPSPRGRNMSYSGTAGHSTFIIDVNVDYERLQNDEIVRHGTLSLVSQDDPQHIHASPPCPMLVDALTPLVFHGWTAIFSDGTPTSTNGSYDQGWEMQAVSLDALMKETGSGQERRHNLGKSIGINITASLTTGKIVTLPAPAPKDVRDGDFISSYAWSGTATIATIFDPSTQKTVPTHQASGLIRAVGIISATTPDNLEAKVRVLPVNGDPGISFPISPSSIFHPPGAYEYNPGMNDNAVTPGENSALSVLHAPGANIITFNPTPQGNDTPHTYRLFGIPEADAQ